MPELQMPALQSGELPNILLHPHFSMLTRGKHAEVSEALPVAQTMQENLKLSALPRVPRLSLIPYTQVCFLPLNIVDILGSSLKTSSLPNTSSNE